MEKNTDREIHHNSINIEIYCIKYWPILQFSLVKFVLKTFRFRFRRDHKHRCVVCRRRRRRTCTDLEGRESENEQSNVVLLTVTSFAYCLYFVCKSPFVLFGIYCMWRHFSVKNMCKNILKWLVCWLQLAASGFFFNSFSLFTPFLFPLPLVQLDSRLTPHPTSSFRSAVHFSIQFNKNLYLYFCRA